MVELLIELIIEIILANRIKRNVKIGGKYAKYRISIW